MTGEPLPCVRLAYAFFYLPTAQAAALLRLSLDAANQVLAVDFKLAAFLGKPPRPWPQALRDYVFSDYLPAQNKKDDSR